MKEYLVTILTSILISGICNPASAQQLIAEDQVDHVSQIQKTDQNYYQDGGWLNKNDIRDLELAPKESFYLDQNYQALEAESWEDTRKENVDLQVISKQQDPCPVFQKEPEVDKIPLLEKTQKLDKRLDGGLDQKQEELDSKNNESNEFGDGKGSYPSTEGGKQPPNATKEEKKEDSTVITSKPKLSEPFSQPEDSELSPEEIKNIELFRKNTPKVVNIANKFNISEGNALVPMDEGTQPLGLGSGFIWDKKGHVVTNYHVVRGANELAVTLIDQSVYKGKVIGIDANKDVAVLKLDIDDDKASQLSTIDLGQSSTLLVGQRVFAIGNPFGLEHTLTQGIISGLGREIQSLTGTPIQNIIQSDAAINPGNSGGVLLNSKGLLIGINTAIADPSGRGASSGVGFAIPIDTVKGLVDQILKYGKVVRPVIGVSIAPPQVLSQLGIEGVLILKIPEGSPAQKAGLRPTKKTQSGLVLGDIIVSIDGKKIKNYNDLYTTLDRYKVGQDVQVEVLRTVDSSLASEAEVFGTTKLSVTLGDLPSVQYE